jgi:hypothetical protein
MMINIYLKNDFFKTPTQDIYKSENCRTDYLEIRDGYWHKSPILGRFCGSGKVNELITTTGSRMLLTFVSSIIQPGLRGFAASYEGKLSPISSHKLNCMQLSRLL